MKRRTPVARDGLALGRELALFAAGHQLVAGLDEVGRGPLAGPVLAAAVILDPVDVPAGLADSKIVPAAAREALCDALLARARAIGIGAASPREIDALNIRQATFLAMRRAVGALPLRPDYLLVDGRDLPDVRDLPGEAIVRGDATCASIAAASIVAKAVRDRLMTRQHKLDERYGFDRHKGYPTAEHRRAIAWHGPSPLHRLSFAPCADGRPSFTSS